MNNDMKNENGPQTPSPRAITILTLIEKANKKALIGDSDAYQTLFEDYKKA